MRKSFLHFLRAHNSAEGVQFWEAVHARKAETGTKRLFESANDIIRMYIAEEAERQIHLSSAVRRHLLSAYEHNNKSELGRVDLFNAAIGELYKDVKQNPLFGNFFQTTFAGPVKPIL